MERVPGGWKASLVHRWFLPPRSDCGWSKVRFDVGRIKTLISPHRWARRSSLIASPYLTLLISHNESFQDEDRGAGAAGRKAANELGRQAHAGVGAPLKQTSVPGPRGLPGPRSQHAQEQPASQDWCSSRSGAGGEDPKPATEGNQRGEAPGERTRLLIGVSHTNTPSITQQQRYNINVRRNEVINHGQAILSTCAGAERRNNS